MSAIIYMGFLYVTCHAPLYLTYFSSCGDCWLWDVQGGGLLSVRSHPGQLPPTQPPLHPFQLLSSSWSSSSSSVHYREEQQHLSLALAAFFVHPVRISRNLESCDNMEYQMGTNAILFEKCLKLLILRFRSTFFGLNSVMVNWIYWKLWASTGSLQLNQT